MASDTKIQWTHHTFNPWRGCTKVSAGCANCYAETFSGRNPQVLGVWGPNGTRVVAAEAQWREPLKWNAAAQRAGERHRVFCASLADVFEDWRGPMVDSQGRTLYATGTRPEWIASKKADGSAPNPDVAPCSMQDVRARLFKVIGATPALDWLLLTKRPENILPLTRAAIEPDPEVCEPNGLDVYPFGALFPNVWLGTSVENQEAANARVTHLLRVPAAVRFLSCEPLLGPVRLDAIAGNHPDGSPFTPENPYRGSGPGTYDATARGLDWVIVGGESGPGARPMHLAWARDLLRQCEGTRVRPFVKQLGAVPTVGDPAERLKLTDPKGGDASEFPPNLRVRQFPTPTSSAKAGAA